MKFAALHLVSGPDIQAARCLHNCDGLNDEDASHILFHQHGWDPKSSFRFGDDAVHLPFFLQHIVAASLLVVDGSYVELSSLSVEHPKSEKELLHDLHRKLLQHAGDCVIFAWQGAAQLLPLINARRSLHGVSVALPPLVRDLAADYIHTERDNEERQLDAITALHQLPSSARPLNVSTDPAGCQLAQQHANARALQLGFLAARQLQVSGEINTDLATHIEKTLRQQLNQTTPVQEKL